MLRKSNSIITFFTSIKHSTITNRKNVTSSRSFFIASIVVSLSLLLIWSSINNNSITYAIFSNITTTTNPSQNVVVKNDDTNMLNNQINNVIRNKNISNQAPTTITSPSNQNPLVDLETMMFGKSSFSSNGLRLLADVAPFRIVGGHVSVNLPSNDIKVIAAQITDRGIEHAVIVDLTKTLTISSAEALYHTDLGASISGTNPFTKKHDTVFQFTDLLLWNSGSSSIELNDDNAITMVIVYQ